MIPIGMIVFVLLAGLAIGVIIGTLRGISSNISNVALRLGAIEFQLQRLVIRMRPQTPFPPPPGPWPTGPKLLPMDREKEDGES